MPQVVHKSYCRTCFFGCAVEVGVDNGRVVSVNGDRSDPIFHGYTCVKGRAEPALLNDPDRIRHSLKRGSDGSFQRIDLPSAIHEIAEVIAQTIKEYGPRAVATYLGTKSYNSSATMPVAWAMMEAIGSPMRFTPETIDKPGKPIARAMLGQWMAPAHSFYDPDVALFIGLNPLIAYQGIPLGHPGEWLKAMAKRNMKLIVIDPRRTETASRAFIHLQPRPGHDAAILAAMLHVIFEDGLWDRDFVGADVAGVEALRDAVAAFPPDDVAQRAGVDVHQLILAARTFGEARRGFVVPGTGPIMSAPGPLVDYLALCLDTVCGHWMRAGELLPAAPVLHRIPKPIAQAAPPITAYGFGEALRVRGLSDSVAGMPTAALPDEILLEGNGRVRVLISVGGNPALAWPDQDKSIRALKSLDLLVQIDPWMSATAQLADYVIAPKMPYEVASATILHDDMRIAREMGPAIDYGMYTPAVCQPPPDSQVIAEWEFFFELARVLGLESLTVKRHNIQPTVVTLDRTLTTDEVFDIITAGSRISLDDLRSRSGAHTFATPEIEVAPKQTDWPHRLNVGHADMLADLAAVRDSWSGRDDELKLICRRMQHVYNSSNRHPSTHRGRPYNPAFLHPAEIDRLHLRAGEVVRIRSADGEIDAIVAPDETLRAGVVSIAHSFGDLDGTDVRIVGANTSRLITNDVHFDRYAGQPMMSNIPVAISPLRAEV